jgi:hypothetical protein
LYYQLFSFVLCVIFVIFFFFNSLENSQQFRGHSTSSTYVGSKVLPLPCLGSGFDHGSFYAERVCLLFLARKALPLPWVCWEIISQPLGAVLRCSYTKNYIKKFMKKSLKICSNGF